MTDFLLSLLKTTLVMSVLIGIVICINQFLGNRYAAKWRYFIWIIIVLGLILPIKPQIHIPSIQINIPASLVESTTKQQANIEGDLSATDSGIDSQDTTKDNAVREQQSSTPFLTAFFFIIWLIGVVVLSLYFLVRHFRHLLSLRKWAKEVEDQKALLIIEKAMDVLKIKPQSLQIKTSKIIKNPVLVGYIRPVVYLPEVSMSYENFEVILRHELVHLKRRDLWIKSAAVVANIIHWFNPLVYVMSYMMQTDCEISCDAKALEGYNLEERKFYSDTIINITGLKKEKGTVFSTSLFAGKHNIKKRLASIMDMHKKNFPLAVGIIAIVLTFTTFSSSFITFAYPGDSHSVSDVTVSWEEAEELALKKTGGGIVTECILIEENGTWVYKIQIVKDDVLYLLSIDAYTGEIYSLKEAPSDVEVKITAERAMQIALEKVGGGVVSKYSLEKEDGIWYYYMEVKVDKDTIYTIKINANNGLITEFTDSQGNTSSVDNENISSDSAKETALNRTGGGTVVDSYSKYENGQLVYYYVIQDDEGYHTISVDGASGDVLDVSDSKSGDSNDTVKDQQNGVGGDTNTNTDTNSSSNSSTSIISVARANEIALAYSGGGTVINTQSNSTKATYSVEIINQSLRYYITIDAYTGNVISSTTKSAENFYTPISTTRAKEIAVATAGGGVATDCKLVHNSTMYELYVSNGSNQYVMLVDVQTGEVYNFTKL